MSSSLKTYETHDIRLALLIALVLATAASVACGGAREQAQADDLPKVDFEKVTLDNGLEVIFHEDHRVPLVAVNLWYHVGPANEGPGLTGFAHLFEHMMFQGSKHVPGDMHIRAVEGAGGDMNGSTDFDRTNYFETLPSDQLELALWLESDRMGYLLDKLDQAALSNQQDVVRNERRQTHEGVPYGMVEEALYHQLFPKGHPYYADVIGSHADIQAAQLADVRNFFKLYYSPNNASLAIVGDFDTAAARRMVEKYFGTLKRGAPVPKPSVQTPPITSERRAIVADRVELPRVYMAWITSPIYKPGDADADITSIALGDGRSSRLYKKLVYEKQIAQDVSVFQQSLMLGSVFEIEATARPGHTPEEIEKAIDDELAILRESGLAAEEVTRARNQMETQIVQSLERFNGLANRLNSYNHFIGDPGFIPNDVQRYRDVTPESVKTFVQQQLAPNARVVIYGVPGEPDAGAPVATPSASDVPSGAVESVNADEPWRQQQPPRGEARPLQIPPPQRFELANGLTVLVNERPGLPIVSASFVLKTGSDANPADRPGLASFTTAMLDEGTATRSALQIADEVAQLGGTLTTGSSVDSLQVGAGSLRRNFPAMLGILADVVRHPSFPEEEVERQRASRLATLVQQRDDPNAVVSLAMYAALYGPGHPYGYPEIGTEGSARAITRDEMQQFWAQYFVPNNAALVVSGQITADELKTLVDQSFGDWARGTPEQPVLNQPATTRSRVVLVDKPGSPQTQLRVASIGLPRATPDFEAVQVMNEALGGLFSSRINLNLREQHGYTYGAVSQFVFRRTAGPFAIGSAVRTDVTAPAVSEILKEVGKMGADGLTPEELTLSKDSLVRSLPAQFETAGRVTTSTSSIYIYDLGLDYYAKLSERLAAVTAEQAKAAAQKYLVPERLTVVAVGDRTRIAPALQKLNLGAIEVRNTDGTVGAEVRRAASQ